MAQAADRQRQALQVIFSFFLGLMVTAFVGVGVNTFYPSPDTRYSDEIDQLYQEQNDLEMAKDRQNGLTAEEEQRLQELRDEVRAVDEKQREQGQTWARNTSIILILFATFVMSVSLVRSEQLRIISNGLLLGGVFTMLYGTGWVIASGSSWIRFAVMSFALAVTFALGYARFVRSRDAERPPTGVAEVGGAGDLVSDEELMSIAARVAALERRTAAAASALSRAQDED